MNFWAGLALIAALHVLVNLWLQPRVEQRWRSASAYQVVAKAGTIAALQTAGDFLRVAALTFGIIAFVFLVLQLIAPATTLGALSQMQSAALLTRDWAKAIGGWLGQILFWIGVAGAFLIIWSLTVVKYRETLVVEYLRQLRALALSERKGELEPLPPTAEMHDLAEEFAIRGTDASDHERRRMVHRLRRLDLVRRIDLSKQAVPLGAGGKGNRLLRLIFSEGMVEIGKNSTKRLGKVGTAATCLLLIGTATPALRGEVIEPTIDTLAGLRLERELAKGETQLRKLAGTPPVPAAPDDPDYRMLAEQFLDALSDSNGWAQASVRLADRAILPDGESKLFDDSFDRMVARDAVVRSYAGDPANRTRSFAFEDLPANDTGRLVLEEMRARDAGTTALRARAVERLALAFRKAGKTVPGFRDKLKTSLAGFDKPARLGTFATMALSDQFALAVGAALPGPGSEAVLEAETVRAERKGLQKSFEQIAKVRFSNFLNDIVAGKPLGTALRRVQGGGVDQLLRLSDAARISALLDDADARRNNFLMRGFERPAVLAASVDPAEAKTVRQLLEGPDWQVAMPIVAKYDDLLPGTAMALPTALGVAATQLDRPRQNLILRPAEGGRVMRTKVKPKGGSLLGLALTAASIATATEVAADTSNVFESRGITVNADLTSADYEIRNLSWRLSAGCLQLQATEANQRLLPTGPVNPAMARAALALAADGRPAALIALPINELGWTRWLLHPVIADTRIGAELIGLYRRAPSTPVLDRRMASSRHFDGLTVVENAEAIKVSKETRDFLALVAIFRGAFRGQLGIEASSLVELARALEPYRLARLPVLRLSTRTHDAPAGR